MPCSIRYRCCLALALGMAGCNTAPHYSRPAADSPAAFKEAVPTDVTPEGGWKIAEPRDERVRDKWWESYNDPELNGLEEKVATANQNVLAAEANYREARALVISARAALLPTVSVAPSVTRSRSNGLTSFSSAGSTTAANTGTDESGANGSAGNTTSTRTTTSPGTTRTIYTAPIDASYEFDVWHRVRNSIAENAYAAQRSSADLANVLLTAQAELAQNYFQARSLDEQRHLLQGTLADYRASLHLVSTLATAGMASDEDVAQANTQFSSAQAQETDLGIARAQYEHAIAVLIGIPPARFALPVQSFNPILPAIPLSLPSDLLERRPDVASAERQVAAANAAIGVARAAYFPTLSITGSAGFESTSLPHLFDWPNRFWSLGGQLAETVFDGGVRRAANERARAAYDVTVANYRQTVLAALQAVEDNLSTLRILAVEKGQEHDAVTSSLNAVKLSVTRYQNGLDSYVNVITAQNSFLTSREAELQVQLRAMIASIGLMKNLGGGWDQSKLPGFALASKPKASQSAGDPNAPLAVSNPPPLPPSPPRPDELLEQDRVNSGIKKE